MQTEAANHNKPWTKEEDGLIISSKNTLTSKNLSEILNRSHSSIRGRANKLGVKFKFGKRRHVYDDSFFEKPNLLNCFWAGVIATDGCISKDGYTILQISDKDSSFISTFKEDVGYSGKIMSIDNHNPRFNNFSKLKRLSIKSNQWRNDLLANFNLMHDKTKRLTEPPLIRNNYEYCLSFIAGAICGDGTIHVDKHDKTIKLCFVGCGFQFLLFIKDFMDRYFHWDTYGQRETTVKECNRTKNYYYYSIFGHRAADILKSIRKLQLPYLKRKFDNEKLNNRLSKYPILITNSDLLTDISKSEYEVSQISV